MRSLSHAALVVLSLSVASLAGCNSLTEPSEFRVVKETPKQQPAPAAGPDAAKGPGGAVPATLEAKPGTPDNVRAASEAAPRNQARMNAAPANAPQAGSCGE
jgi:hypothetical protein